MRFTLPAFAKINWFLRVLGKREDGFHEICTAFQTVSLKDELDFAENDELVLTCDDSSIPVNHENLVLQAAQLLQETYRVKKGAHIHLRKRIPSPGGLAGGSSDAATALLGLSRLWNIRASLKELSTLASKIGSDVPFFLYGGTCFGLGRGTEIVPTQDIEEPFMLIVTPNVSIPTKLAYQRLNLASLTNSDLMDNLKICYHETERLRSYLQTSNDFEKVVFEISSEVKEAKQKLLELGARIALMSGSGASVFAVFESETTRQTAMEKLKSEWKKFAVTTVTRKAYREAFACCFDFVEA